MEHEHPEEDDHPARRCCATYKRTVENDTGVGHNIEDNGLKKPSSSSLYTFTDAERQQYRPAGRDGLAQ